MSEGEPRTTPMVLREVLVRTLAVEAMSGTDAGRSATATGESLSVGTSETNDLVLTDPTVSRFHFTLTSRPDGILVVDSGSTNGTMIAGVRIERAIVPRGAVLQIGQASVRVGEGKSASYALYPDDALAGLHGRSIAMRKLMARIQRAAQSAGSALVIGESGTGKELVARALHDLGPRAKRPFVTVDCGSLAPTLVASELFGHEKGAFTGADRQQAGAFEQAQGGTVFLDEIGELPASLQSALLGVLERRKFRRVGGRSEIAVDVRVIAATNRELRSEVNSGTFRLDLYHRLAVLVLELPPLRERADDVPLLVEHFARESGHDGAIELLVPPDMMAELSRHRWSGNVRELRNVVESLVAMGEWPERPETPRAPTASGDAARTVGADIASVRDLPYKHARASVLEWFEADYVRALFERTAGNISRAAREGQVDRSHLKDLMRRHKIRPGGAE